MGGESWRGSHGEGGERKLVRAMEGVKGEREWEGSHGEGTEI